MYQALLTERKLPLLYFTQIKRISSLKKTNSNYYDILGVGKRATAKEIKLAYYKKCKLLHPDSNKKDPASHTKFIELNKAYSVLSVDSSRKNYDTTLSQPSYAHQFNQGYQNTYNPNYKWNDIEYERFIRYTQDRNRYYDNQNYYAQSKNNETKFQSPFPLMILLILTLALFEWFAFSRMYDHDMSHLRSEKNFNPMLKQNLDLFKTQIDNGNLDEINEKLRLVKEEEKLPLIRVIKIDRKDGNTVK